MSDRLRPHAKNSLLTSFLRVLCARFMAEGGVFSRRKLGNIQPAVTADREQAYSCSGLRHTAIGPARVLKWSRADDNRWRTAVPGSNRHFGARVTGSARRPAP